MRLVERERDRDCKGFEAGLSFFRDRSREEEADGCGLGEVWRRLRVGEVVVEVDANIGGGACMVVVLKRSSVCVEASD